MKKRLISLSKVEDKFQNLLIFQAKLLCLKKKQQDFLMIKILMKLQHKVTMNNLNNPYLKTINFQVILAF